MMENKSQKNIAEKKAFEASMSPKCLQFAVRVENILFLLFFLLIY